MQELIIPNWPAPTWVRGFTTTRHAPDINTLSYRFGFNASPIIYQQVHRADLYEITANNLVPSEQPVADGALTQLSNIPCCIRTADCLPLLLTDEKGSVVSALHCGWRGIAAGIIAKAVSALRAKTKVPLLAWLGPAIGSERFEVGPDVWQTFLQQDLLNNNAFLTHPNPYKRHANIYQLAKNSLYRQGVTNIYGGDFCTYQNEKDFYSYRRDNKETGRMISAIWISQK